jgi:hypothetical protein
MLFPLCSIRQGSGVICSPKNAISALDHHVYRYYLFQNVLLIVAKAENSSPSGSSFGGHYSLAFQVFPLLANVVRSIHMIRIIQL